MCCKTPIPCQSSTHRLNLYGTPSRQFWYRYHQERVRTAKKYVDASSPKIGLNLDRDFKNMRGDSMQLRETFRQNIELLLNMGEVSTSREGRVNSFRHTEDKQNLFTRIPQMQHSLQKIQRENSILGNRIKNIRSMISTRSMPTKLCDVKKVFVVPTEILAKYKGEVPLPLCCHTQRRLFRPRIFFDLEVTGVRPLGRIIIQLYTEACPEVVLALVRACKEPKQGRLRFVRIFPQLWLEGLLMLDSNTLRAPKIEYDKRALSHNSDGYILSFPAAYLKGVPNGLFSFTISFRPLNLDEQASRVAFGAVQYGRKCLNLMKDFGTKYGSLRKPIGIIGMGILH